jgi:hypothetical protein
MEGSTAGLHRVPKVFQHYNTTVSLANRWEGQRGSSSSTTTTKTNVQDHKSSVGPTLQRLDEIPLRSLATAGEEMSALLGGRSPDEGRRKRILGLGPVESRGRHRRYFCGHDQSSRHTSARSAAPHHATSLPRNSRADTKRNRIGQLLSEVL